MPHSVRKSRGKNCYVVRNKQTRKVFAKCSTKENAIKQSKLLRAIMFNPDFVPRTLKTTRVKPNKKRTSNTKKRMNK